MVYNNQEYLSYMAKAPLGQAIFMLFDSIICHEKTIPMTNLTGGFSLVFAIPIGRI